MYKKSLAKWEHQQETFIMLSKFALLRRWGAGAGGFSESVKKENS